MHDAMHEEMLCWCNERMLWVLVFAMLRVLVQMHVQCNAMHAEAEEKQREEAERGMECNKLAARPSLHKRGSRRTNVLAAWASWLLVRGRPKALVRLGQVKMSKSSRGHEKEKMLASRRGSKQAEKVGRGNAMQRMS